MNRKTGLEYFPLDIDFFMDEKIQFVSARFGTKGEAIAVRLLCKIYRQGYYTEWNDDMALLFAKSVGDGCRDSCVKDVVHELLKRGFFDRGIFERFSILTSRGIQRRYFEAVVRRKGVAYEEDYILVDVEKYDNIVKVAQNTDTKIEDVDISSENVDILPQSRVEESKVKESKEEKKKSGTPTRTQKKFVPPTIEQIAAYCKERGNDVDPQKFFDYFTESGWIDSQGKPVKNWKQKIITWEGRGNIRPLPKPSTPKKNRFCNFDQRDTDYDKIEKMEQEYIRQKYGGDGENFEDIVAMRTKMF